MQADVLGNGANLLSLPLLNDTSGMESQKLLTIAQTAELLNCSTGFVRKRISLTESRQPGGWPKNCYVNLQPNGVKSLFRINIDALQEHLNQKEEEAKVCEM